MSKATAKAPSPIGTPVSTDIARELRTNAANRAEYERLAGFEGLARLIIIRRAALNLSQEELATRMKTTASAISRIESGQHPTSVRTLKRLAEALDVRLVIGFEHGPAKRPKRELVAV